MVSMFDKKREEDQEADKAKIEFEENNILDDDEPDRLPEDPYVGKRIHCWCLIKKGPRKMDKDVFIEPSTGRHWACDNENSPFLKIDQVFNHKNFWINLRPKVKCQEVNFGTMNVGEADDWEYVM